MLLPFAAAFARARVRHVTARVAPVRTDVDLRQGGEQQVQQPGVERERDVDRLVVAVSARAIGALLSAVAAVLGLGDADRII